MAPPQRFVLAQSASAFYGHAILANRQAKFHNELPRAVFVKSVGNSDLLHSLVIIPSSGTQRI